LFIDIISEKRDDTEKTIDENTKEDKTVENHQNSKESGTNKVLPECRL